MSRLLCSVLVACALAPAAASELPAGSRRRWLQSREPGQRRRQPPLAMAVTEPIFELAPEDYADDRPHLLMFRGRGDDYCKQMEPHIEKLKLELGVDVRTFECWYETKNVALLQKFDRGRCGGVPFFYNKRTRRFICGATTYENLRVWALGEICEPFLPPPNINQQQEPSEMQGKMGELFQKIKGKAQEKMDEQKAKLEARRGGGSVSKK